MILDCMLGTGFGGLEKVFLDQLRVLPAGGLDVHGVARRGSPAAARAIAAQLPCSAMRVFTEWDPVTLSSARALIREYDPKLLLCHGRKAHRIFAKVADGRPIAAMIHKPKFDRDLPAAAYIVVAEHRKRTLTEQGVPAAKVMVVPNAVAPPETFKENYDIGTVPHILALGRLHPKKGFDVLIAALAILSERRTPFTCTIAGDGPMRAALEKDIAKRGLAGRVTLAGWTDDAASFLAAGDIFAFPSFQEDFPLVMLDAMASGLPIVSSDIDGPGNILIDRQTALLVPPHDAQVLADALRRAIEDRNLRETIGRNARTQALRDFGFEAVGNKLSGVLANIAEGRMP